MTCAGALEQVEPPPVELVELSIEGPYERGSPTPVIGVGSIVEAATIVEQREHAYDDLVRAAAAHQARRRV